MIDRLLRAQGLADRVGVVGFAAFVMNLVGVDEVNKQSSIGPFRFNHHPYLSSPYQTTHTQTSTAPP